MLCGLSKNLDPKKIRRLISTFVGRTRYVIVLLEYTECVTSAISTWFVLCFWFSELEQDNVFFVLCPTSVWKCGLLQRIVLSYTHIVKSEEITLSGT